MVDMKQPITKKKNIYIYIYKNKIRYQDTESVVCKCANYTVSMR